MKETPLLFSGPMVRALLNGSKTQTRRIVKVEKLHADMGQPNLNEAKIDPSYMRPQYGSVPCLKVPFDFGTPNETWHRHFPCWEVPSRLWVKETFSAHGAFGTDGRISYRADIADGKEPHGLHWKPSIFMPRRASRITLEILSVRVERLQAISEEDAKAEGAPWLLAPISDEPQVSGIKWNGHKVGYAHLWESINGKGSWDANPWVWVLTFKREEKKG